MEFLRNVIENWLLFSIIEGIIYTLFFIKFGGFKNPNCLEFLLMTLVNGILSLFFPPIVYQALMLIFMSCFIYLTNSKNINIKTCFKIVLMSMMFLLVVDMTYSMILEVFGIVLSDMNDISVVCYGYLIKTLEIIILIVWSDKMKKFTWLGNAQKPERPSK